MCLFSNSLTLFFPFLLSKPFPIGDRVTFSGKDCVCQQCSRTLVKPNEPIKIHGPSRKSGVRLALSVLFRATRRYSALSLMRCVHEAHLAHLANQVSVKSVVRPVALICQLRITQHKQTHHSFITVNMQENRGFYIITVHLLTHSHVMSCAIRQVYRVSPFQNKSRKMTNCDPKTEQ